jgi:hypothetical protein
MFKSGGKPPSRPESFSVWLNFPFLEWPSP